MSDAPAPFRTGAGASGLPIPIKSNGNIFRRPGMGNCRVHRGCNAPVIGQYQAPEKHGSALITTTPSETTIITLPPSVSTGKATEISPEEGSNPTSASFNGTESSTTVGSPASTHQAALTNDSTIKATTENGTQTELSPTTKATSAMMINETSTAVSLKISTSLFATTITSGTEATTGISNAAYTTSNGKKTSTISTSKTNTTSFLQTNDSTLQVTEGTGNITKGTSSSFTEAISMMNNASTTLMEILQSTTSTKEETITSKVSVTDSSLAEPVNQTSTTTFLASSTPPITDHFATVITENQMSQLPAVNTTTISATNFTSGRLLFTTHPHIPQTVSASFTATEVSSQPQGHNDNSTASVMDTSPALMSHVSTASITVTSTSPAMTGHQTKATIVKTTVNTTQVTATNFTTGWLVFTTKSQVPQTVSASFTASEVSSQPQGHNDNSTASVMDTSPALVSNVSTVSITVTSTSPVTTTHQTKATIVQTPVNTTQVTATNFTSGILVNTTKLPITHTVSVSFTGTEFSSQPQGHNNNATTSLMATAPETVANVSSGTTSNSTAPSTTSTFSPIVIIATNSTSMMATSTTKTTKVQASVNTSVVTITNVTLGTPVHATAEMVTRAITSTFNDASSQYQGGYNSSTITVDATSPARTATATNQTILTTSSSISTGPSAAAASATATEQMHPTTITTTKSKIPTTTTIATTPTNTTMHNITILPNAVQLYPYGLSVGDTGFVRRVWNFNSRLFKPDIGFPFAKHLYNSLYFTDNGQIIFPRSDNDIFSYVNPPARGFSATSSVPMVAVFWDDADFSQNVGSTFYQEYSTLNTVNNTFVQDVETMIHKYMKTSYKAKYTLKITWDKAPAFQAKVNDTQTNTYQAVLTTDGSTSYVLILFKNGGMNWDVTSRTLTNVLIGYSSGQADGFFKNDDIMNRSAAEKYRPSNYVGFNTDGLGITYTNYADDTQIIIPLTGDYDKDLAFVNRVYLIIQAWMASHGLCLNDDKTELLILGTAPNLNKLGQNYSSFVIDNNIITVAKEVKTLGFYLDSTLTFKKQVNAMASDMRGLWIYQLDNNAPVNYRLKCQEWYKDQPAPTSWNLNLLPCPCSMQQGQLDARFRKTKAGLSNTERTLRSSSPNRVGAGVRCVYTLKGQLQGGYQEKDWVFSLSSSSAYEVMNDAFTFSDTELQAFDWCCHKVDNPIFCDRYKEKRPPMSCTEYQPLFPGNMEPSDERNGNMANTGLRHEKEQPRSSKSQDGQKNNESPAQNGCMPISGFDFAGLEARLTERLKADFEALKSKLAESFTVTNKPNDRHGHFDSPKISVKNKDLLNPRTSPDLHSRVGSRESNIVKFTPRNQTHVTPVNKPNDKSSVFQEERYGSRNTIQQMTTLISIKSDAITVKVMTLQIRYDPISDLALTRWFYGDPHITTLDASSYTFNGLGDFTLLNAMDTDTYFILQGRTIQTGTTMATNFNAFASLYSSMTCNIQVEWYLQNDTILVAVNKTFVNLLYSEDMDADVYNSAGLLLIRGNSSVTAMFDGMLSLSVSTSFGILSAITSLPTRYINKTSGLLGVWNFDTTDDFRMPNGTTISIDSTDKEIFNYGMTWQVVGGSSLFSKFPTSQTNSTTFVPGFYDELIKKNVTEYQAAATACGGNVECIYDTLSTGNAQLGAQTQRIAKTYKQTNLTLNLDECSLGSSCSSRATCTNTVGSYKCTCNSGFNGDGFSCVDVNECNSTTLCSSYATCTNTAGSYTCACNPGYQGNGTSCDDEDECSRPNLCSQTAVCTNTQGSYMCSCKPGFQGDGFSCVDVNECNSTTLCSSYATCTNTAGSYTCACNPGYQGNGTSCDDVDECSRPNLCSQTAVCTNTQGSYMCSCKPGFQGNGTFCCSTTCEDLTYCKNGGTCTRTGSECQSPTCTCSPGYEGHQCTSASSSFVPVAIKDPPKRTVRLGMKSKSTFSIEDAETKVEQLVEAVNVKRLFYGNSDFSNIIEHQINLTSAFNYTGRRSDIDFLNDNLTDELNQLKGIARAATVKSATNLTLIFVESLNLTSKQDLMKYFGCAGFQPTVYELNVTTFMCESKCIGYCKNNANCNLTANGPICVCVPFSMYTTSGPTCETLTMNLNAFFGILFGALAFLFLLMISIILTVYWCRKRRREADDER
ncbi:mucin-4-like [Ambystoma mexicanum]|uniref:mucin-4-like n=1 Tax=Ambystoma mexicanum TaxID=8296 RepID=UPI0037E7BF20